MHPSRRRFLHGATLLAAGCGSGAERRPEGAFRAGLQERPDIVFICIDDLNDWPSPFVGPKPTVEPSDVLTPNMAELAQWGTVFQRAYCAAPICGASRSATLTGLPPHVSGVTENESILNPKAGLGPLLVDEFTTLPRVLQAAGYRTLGVGKVFHDGGYYNRHKNYDIDAWDEYALIARNSGCPKSFPDATGNRVDAKVRPCPDDWILSDMEVASFAIEKLEEAPTDDAPLFLAAGFFKPHAPWEAPESYYSLYPPEIIQPVIDFVEREDQSDLTLSGCSSLRDLQQSPLDALWDKRSSAAIAGYLASITHTDHLLGTVIEAAKKRPRRTVVVLWSDHGYFMGEKHGWKKPKLYERASRVPLIIADTAFPTPQDSYEAVSLGDLFATVVDYAITPTPPEHGISLRPLVEDADAPWERTSVVTTYNFRAHHTLPNPDNDPVLDPDLERCMDERGVVFCEQDCPDSYGVRMSGASHALRTQRPGQEYRYIRFHDSPRFQTTGGGKVPNRELYDLAVDPLERVNLLAPENVDKSIEELAMELDAELQLHLG